MYARSNIKTDKDTTPKTLSFSSEFMEEVDKSWAGEFRRTVMKNIDEDKFSVLYDSKPSRPNYPVAILIGIMFLAPFLGVPEDQILCLMVSDIYVMYALGIGPNMKPPSKRTLIRFRARLIGYTIVMGADLLHEQALLIAQAAAESMEIKMEFFRMDSTMLNSFIKPLSRQQLLYRVNQGMVYHLLELSRKKIREDTRKRQPKMKDVFFGKKDDDLWHDSDISESLAYQKALEHNLPKELYHYLSPSDYNRLFYGRKNTDKEVLTKVEREAMVLSDAYLIWKTYKTVCGESNEFKIFLRVIAEQCERVMVKSKDGQEDQASGLRFKASNKEIAEREAKVKEIKRLESSIQKAKEKIEKLESKSKPLTSRQKEALTKARDNLADSTKKYDELKNSEDYQDPESELEYTLPVEAEFLNGLDKMNSSILQSPVDPDSTFCEKAKKFFRGYKITIIEVCDGYGRSIPVAWVTTQNVCGDAIAGGILIRAIGKLVGALAIVAADGGFSGPTIEEAAKEAGVTLVNTDLTGVVKACSADHVFTDDGQKIKECAGGQEPRESSIDSNGIVSSKMDADTCRNCKYFDQCRPTIIGQSKTATMKTSLKQKNHAIFKRQMGSRMHVTVGNFRNGVEALMSLIKKVTFVIRMPIYTLERVSLYNDCAMVAVVLKKVIAQKNLAVPDRGIANVNDLAELYEDNEDDKHLLEREICAAKKEFEGVAQESTPLLTEEKEDAGTERTHLGEPDVGADTLTGECPDLPDCSPVPIEGTDGRKEDASPASSETEGVVPTEDTIDEEDSLPSDNPPMPEKGQEESTENSDHNDPVSDETESTDPAGVTETDNDKDADQPDSDSAPVDETAEPAQVYLSDDSAPGGAGTPNRWDTTPNDKNPDPPGGPPGDGKKTNGPEGVHPPDDPITNKAENTESDSNETRNPLDCPADDEKTCETSTTETLPLGPLDGPGDKDVNQIPESTTPSFLSGFVEFVPKRRRRHRPRDSEGS